MRSRFVNRLLPAMLTALLLTVVAVQTGSAYMDGQPDAGTYDGCGSTALGEGCHSTAPSPDVSAVVTGFPTTYQAGKTYTITVTAEGGPESASAVQRGFYFEVTGGTLAAPSTMEGKVEVLGKMATHTGIGAREQVWALQWTAPASGLVKAKAFVNDVDGDGTNGPGDLWSSYEGTAFSGDGATAKTPGLPVVAVLAAALGIVATRRR